MGYVCGVVIYMVDGALCKHSLSLDGAVRVADFRCVLK